MLKVVRGIANKEGKKICTETADAMGKGSYVDDSVAGGSHEFIDKLVGEVQEDNVNDPTGLILHLMIKY